MSDIGMVKVIGLVLEGNLVVKVLINREFGYVKVCLDCGVVLRSQEDHFECQININEVVLVSFT